MDNLVLYSDSKENLKYNLALEGCTPENTTTKLCLEFNNGYNLYFKGKIDKWGNCVVNIDALKQFDGFGTAKIEVIAESTHFVIHEMPFEVKKKINVKINENTQSDDIELEVEDKKPSVGIKFHQEQIEEKIVEEKVEEKIVEEKVKEKNKSNRIIKFDDF